ncbi:Uncharacterized protein FKW44_021841, partial [Caligus rogercresseyi]
MTEFEDMNPCIRLTAPWRCSGLAVLSNSTYNVSGFPSEEFIDGENLVNKGVGGFDADFYLTHTIADAPPGKNYTNDDARLDQIGELLFNGVNLSEADLVVLSGDFNTGPGSKPYDAIHRFMTSTALDILKVLRALFDPVMRPMRIHKIPGRGTLVRPLCMIIYSTVSRILISLLGQISSPCPSFISLMMRARKRACRIMKESRPLFTTGGNNGPMHITHKSLGAFKDEDPL